VPVVTTFFPQGLSSGGLFYLFYLFSLLGLVGLQVFVQTLFLFLSYMHGVAHGLDAVAGMNPFEPFYDESESLFRP
jgi:hypothetical protein